jgi:hypothetical protein
MIVNAMITVVPKQDCLIAARCILSDRKGFVWGEQRVSAAVQEEERTGDAVGFGRQRKGGETRTDGRSVGVTG